MTETETENDNDETYIKLFRRYHMSDSTLHIGTLASNNVNDTSKDKMTGWKAMES